MSSKIEQAIDEIEDFIENCKFKSFSNTQIIVDKEELDNLLSELRHRTPDEIKRYQKMISNNPCRCQSQSRSHYCQGGGTYYRAD